MSNSRMVVGFSCVGHGISHLVMLLYPTVVLALEPAWGLSYGELLSLSLAGFVLFGAGALPAGWLGDRWSAERMMVIYFVGTGGACILTGLVSGPLGMAAGLGLIGLFGSIYHPVGIAWLVRASVNRGRVLGLNGLFGSAGLAAAPFVAGALTDLVSWRAAFIVPGILTIVCGLILAVCMKQGTVVAMKEDRLPEKAQPRADMIRVFIVLSVTMAAAGVIFQGLSLALPKVFADGTHAITGGTAAGAGMLVTIVYIVSAGGHVVGGWLADRYPSKPIYVYGWLAQVPLMALCATADNWILFTMVTATTFLQIAVTPAENLLLVKYTPGKWRATAFGAKFVLALGVSAAAVPLVAVIYDRTGSFYWFFVTLAVLGGVIVAAATLLPGSRSSSRTAVPSPAE
ncbi:MFS transporter [Stella humosa]|uniref:MFS transporter n=1 Tax=Stella humosa TaxID=94 RepID=A0A3N1MDF4_9PROT|nr:MFS transporter [Stella humosa]ROQ01761.1 MFS transporter [Stella humosa]BBK32145.1 MFS transporter [Stella humosa]